MRVHKYLPERLYGFVLDEPGQQVFFHLGSFDPGPLQEPPSRCVSCPVSGCSWAATPAPPILGESVEVEVELPDEPGDKAPRADRVVRVHPAEVLHGVVDSFDHLKGFGFVLSEGVSYHLHKSEILEGKIPLVGQRVSFYGGLRKGRPRAVHIQVCP